MFRWTARRVDARIEDILARAGPVSACWDDGDRVIVHDGVVHEAEAAGPDRCQEVLTSLPDVATGPEAPLWMGGIAFDPSHVAEGAWADYPAARFCLPKRQWVWQDGNCTETTVDAPDIASPGGVEGTLPETTRAAWDDGCTAIDEAIRAGRVTKAVLARCDVHGPVDALAAFLRLRGSGDGTAFWFRRGDAVFFGCTPERLVRLQAGRLQTHALAGSRRDGDTAPLEQSGKDILEHELVAAFLRERLVEAGVTGVHQADRGVRRLRHVQHLETPIHGDAAGMHLLDVAHHIHPTPAVCGTPRQRSMELIRRLEGFPRGWYAGTIGWFDGDGDGELRVALRCALATPQACHLFAGAGIVAGSRAAAEWDETETKLTTMREVL